MRILIVRHADPDYDIDSLTDTGWKEAELAADYLSKINVKAFYVSPLGRAQDTAGCTLKKMDRQAETYDWLREFDAQINRPDIPDGKTICWDWLPADMEKFLVETDSADYTYIITAVDILPEAEGELIVDRVDLQVFHTKEGLESRRIGVKGEERPYALYRETARNRAEIFVGRWYLEEVETYEVVFLSLLALERRLAEQPCLILHCAYTEYQGKAMLFSAPSGTGKTTQAGLWEQYRGSRTVNGDKALLEYDGKTWTANGWPVCGTSEVCENKKLPIGCIVMLSQAKLNQAWRLRPAEAFTSLYGQITMNRWDREGLVKNLDLLERLVGKVPIYHLACDISEDAVKTLEQELMGDSSEEAAAAAFLQKNAMRKMEKKA